MPSSIVNWNQLPAELVEKIIREGTDFDPQMLLTLQLVSRIWKASTLRAFSGRFALEIQDSRFTILSRICKDLPSTTRLEITNSKRLLDLSLVSSCSGLSSLWLKHRERHSLSIGPGFLELDLAILPLGLRELKTQLYRIDLDSLEHSGCLGITSLCLEKAQTTPAEIYQMAQLLPRLKELEMSNRHMSIERNGIDFQNFFRLSTLTSLNLYGGNLVSQVEEPLEGAALQNLKLAHVSMSQAWLGIIYQSNVTDLQLLDCYGWADEGGDLQLSSGMLRSLRLFRTPLTLLPHEAPHLRDLSCSAEHGSEESHISTMATFTNLTSLKLIDFRSTDLRALQSLGLQSLGLWEGPNAETTLFAPGSSNPFTALQSVHIFGDTAALEALCATLSDAEPEGQVMIQQLHQTASVLQSLPSLKSTYGKSSVFLGLKEGRNGWKRQYTWYAGDTAHVCLCSPCLASFQRWSR